MPSLAASAGIGEPPAVRVASLVGSTVFAGEGREVPCGSATDGPLLGKPGRQWLSRAADSQLAILVAPTLGEARERARHLVVDLQPVTVGVDEVDTALVHVVHRALDPHIMLEQRAIGFRQRFVARDLEGDMGNTERPGWARGGRRAWRPARQRGSRERHGKRPWTARGPPRGAEYVRASLA